MFAFSSYPRGSPLGELLESMLQFSSKSWKYSMGMGITGLVDELAGGKVGRQDGYVVLPVG